MSFVVTSSLLSAQSKLTSSVRYDLITASKIFVAERSGIHRILLIGGGGGAGYDNGAGGGSGYVVHGTLQLVALASYSVTVGTGGTSALQGTPIGESGTASTFASQDGSIVYLTAAGGLSGTSNSNNSRGGDGGSGGGGGYQYPGGDGGTGGGNGTESATPRPGGDGQGASFTSGFSLFLAAQISAGAGGLGSRVSPFGPGGGGGGIVIDGDMSVTGGLDPSGLAQPGIGYGAGAAGKSDNTTSQPSGPGADGMVLIEWN
jgi:hypothetical protein